MIAFSTKIIIIFNLILILIIFLLSSFFAKILKIPQDTVWIICIGFTTFSFFNLTTNILFGYQNMKRVFKNVIIGDITKFSLSTALIFIGVYILTFNFPFGYYAPLIGTILGFFIISLLRYDVLIFKTSNNCLDKKDIIFKYSLPAFVSMFAFLVFNNVPYLILTILKNPEITGFFSIAMTVTSPILFIPNILNLVSFPLISQLCVEKNAKKKQVYLINSLVRYCLFLVLPITIFLILFSREILLFFAKPEYLLSTSLFPILGPSLIIFGFMQIFLSSLYAIRKPKINRNIMIINAVLFLIFSIPLTFFFSAYGLSFAYFLSVFISLILSYMYLRKYLHIKFLWKDFSKILFSTFIFLSINYISKTIFENFVIKILILIMSGIFYLFILIPLKFYKNDDIELLKIINQKSPKLFKVYIITLIEFLSKFI